MKKYTLHSNYSHSKFVIQNVLENSINSNLLPILNDLLNILLDDSQSKSFDDEKGNEFILNDSAYDELLYSYKIGKIRDDVDLEKELLQTSVIVLHVLLLELLINNYIKLKGVWQFNVLLQNQQEREIFEDIAYRNEFYGLVQEMGINALEQAIYDLLNWIDKLSQLKNNIAIEKPKYNIKITINKAEFMPTRNAINLDFSLIKGYTNESILNPEVIYLRNDNFEESLSLNYRYN